MRQAAILDNPARLLVAIPNWVGDVVLATPVFAALREHFKNSKITYFMRKYVRDVTDGGGWHDDEIYWPDKKAGGLLADRKLVRELRVGEFDAVLLLTNSFRSALVCYLARIPRRVGYARDGRTLLLTDRLKPLRANGSFVPASVLPYYIRIAERIGCPVQDCRLQLGITSAQEAEGASLKTHHKLNQGGPYAVINPGAAFGAAKCWPAERFAGLCDWLQETRGLRCVLVGARGEVPLLREIAKVAHSPVICCDDPGTTLGSLKPLIRDAALLVCNDTGPRHYGNAFNVPTLTMFGPTHQAWTDTDYTGETKLQIPVDCGPCQLRVCPLDHRCMTGISVELAAENVTQLLGRRSPLRKCDS